MQVRGQGPKTSRGSHSAPSQQPDARLEEPVAERGFLFNRNPSNLASYISIMIKSVCVSNGGS